MAVSSTMHPLGSAAPDFDLPDTVSGEQVTLESIRGEVATVVMFLCNHCPYVKHVNAELVSVATAYQDRGVSFVAISANDIESHPEDSPEQMKVVAEQEGYPFPYLYDESQAVAQAYRAVCTPDLFVYDTALTLAYRGRLDASTPGNGAVNDGADLRAALDALVAGTPVAGEQFASMGCSIKWKPAG